MKRPFLVTLLAVVVFLLSCANLARAAIGIARWPLLATLPETLPSQAAIGLGGVWGAVWLVEGWGLWTLRWWARPAGIALFVLYEIAILGDQAVFTRGPYEQGAMLGAVIGSILWAGLVALTLTRSHVRQAFHSAHEEPPIHG